LLFNTTNVHFICTIGEESVIQPEEKMIRTEGGLVTLSCNYITSDPSPYLFWYIQRTNDIPRFILRRERYGSGENGTEFHERFYSKLNFSANSVPLTIQNLQVSDSAVYYCALRPTVTPAHSTLIQLHFICPVSAEQEDYRTCV
uniref:Ig-like domain-containing protein n=1 Tax=Denticeps clupeoides TaxID=299321 RepID=A0AAY4AF24_9TELE